MAQIVLIEDGTHKVGFNNLDDIVSVHDDNVDLSSSSYEMFKIIKVNTSDEPITASEIESRLYAIEHTGITSNYLRRASGLTSNIENALEQGQWTKEQILFFLDNLAVND